jgi:hypothetical protein
MTYEITKNYVCDHCDKKQTKDEQVYALAGEYLRYSNGKIKHACKECLRKGYFPGWG